MHSVRSASLFYGRFPCFFMRYAEDFVANVILKKRKMIYNHKMNIIAVQVSFTAEGK